MFTGIVEELGTVASIEGGDDGLRLQLAAPLLAPLADIGDSINVSGCCLTVVAIDADVLTFELVPETLRRTALAGLAAGSHVNLEDALRAGEPYGGHIVQGARRRRGGARGAPRGGHRHVAALPRARRSSSAT